MLLVTEVAARISFAAAALAYIPLSSSLFGIYERQVQLLHALVVPVQIKFRAKERQTQRH